MIIHCPCCEARLEIEIKEVPKKGYRDIPIIDLDLSIRTVSVLDQNGILTLHDIIERFDEIKKLKGVGRQIYKEVENVKGNASDIVCAFNEG